MAIRKNILVKGFIQAVSYREQTQQVARHLGVKGWVRSAGHGTVEACFEGDQRAVEALIGWCAFGPRNGKVDEVQVLDAASGGEYLEFSIREDRKAA